MTRSRRHFSGAEKAVVVRRYLVDKMAISDLCDELSLQPTQIYTWQKQLFKNGGAAFDRPKRKTKQETANDRQIAKLQAKIQKKNEVVAELFEEYVQLKKELGNHY